MKSNSRLLLERLLLVVGLIAVGISAWSYLHLYISQAWDNWTFDRAAQHSPSGRKLAPGELIGRLVIPRLKTRAIVREGTGESTLGLALGHIPGTALPGQRGNVGVAGHRDTLFRSLEGIAANDTIQFQTSSGTYLYEVESTSIVKPTNVTVLRSGGQSELTLVTCYPFRYIGSAPDRFIVKARLVSKSAPLQEMADLTQRRPNNTARATTPREQAARRKPDPSASHAADAVEEAPARGEEDSRVRKVNFQLKVNQTRQIAGGITFGLSGADRQTQTVDGLISESPDGHTNFLHGQAAHQPVVFYSAQQHERRELVITRITADSVKGYLLLFHEKEMTGTAGALGGQ